MSNDIFFYRSDLSVRTVDRHSVSSTGMTHSEMVTSQTMSETYSSTMQTFESVSTMMMSTTSVKSIEVQQVTSVEEYSTIPTLTLKMSDVIVRLGDVAQFNCSFSGQPFTEIIWDNNGRTITNTERVQYVHQDGLISLIILNVHLGDQGSYCCTVKNRNGENRTSAQLTVEGGYRFCFVLDAHFISSASCWCFAILKYVSCDYNQIKCLIKFTM